MSGLYFGFIPLYNDHFIGLKYSQSTFKAFIENDEFYFEDERSTDTYHRFDVMGRFVLSDRIQIRYVLPYLINNMNGSHERILTSGVGDPIVMLYYTPFNNDDDFSGKIMQTLQVGAGLKVPVGKSELSENGELVNRNFQLGTGSLDYLIGLNYSARYKAIGLNVESSYKFNGTNGNSYRFGNQTTISSNIFYYKETPRVLFLPFTGVYFESSAVHRNQGIIESNTGGESVLATFGIQAFIKKWSVNLQYQTPIHQHFFTDNFVSLSGKDRFSIGFIHSFSFKKADD